MSSIHKSVSNTLSNLSLTEFPVFNADGALLTKEGPIWHRNVSIPECISIAGISPHTPGVISMRDDVFRSLFAARELADKPSRLKCVLALALYKASMGTRISLCTDKIQKSKIETEWSNFTFLLKSDFDGINLNPFHFPPKLINEIDSLKRVIVNAIINFLFHENVFSILRTSKIYRDNPTQEKALAEFVLSFIDRPREKYKKEMKQLMATGPGFLGLHVIEAIRRIERE